ncbi:hypothetical protein KHS38_03345 [Mucilaginibacter sp. Bleaf8]|uniref:hypothetical protein n=1 Tax=Mucilaginibacter sp. Bleaf8 TaxID=2834430 RepID=UPI001BCEAA2E|nr:hypothetical protein [Mucilaginibacter sp. Bleaf8]MBS7563429.1 hypothetical protein [Mucilaginibacter sp. Bleaf8]
MKKVHLFALALLVTTLSSCEAIKGIFKAGFVVGIIAVVVVIFVIIWIINMFRGGGRS